jgi:hypothetical protein
MTDEGVFPNIKVEQNTIILRDISSSTPIDDVQNIFQHLGGTTPPAITSVRSDMNDTWYNTLHHYYNI